MNIQEYFNKSWRAIHQGLNVETELPYYSQVYSEMWELVDTGENEEENRQRLMRLLLYIEDMAGLGISKLLKKEYKLAEDYVWMTIKNFGLSEGRASDLQISIYLAIKHAPRSIIKSWAFQTFMNRNFDQLCILQHWLAIYIEPLNLVLPDVEVVERHFEREFGTSGLPGKYELIASRLIEFNWFDKKGRHIVDLIRVCLKDDIKNVAEFDDIFNISIGNIDIYNIRAEEQGQLILFAPDDIEYPYCVKMPFNAPKEYKDKLIFGIIISWLDFDYLCEPCIWMNDVEEDFDPVEFMNLIKLDIREQEKRENLILSNGEVVNKFEDLESDISFCSYCEMLFLPEDVLNEDKNSGLRDKI